MKTMGVLSSLLLFVFITSSYCQRITTIQLDGVQYFVSRMNPYSPELNFFLSYQYCRSLGLQLVSFETREKADSIAQYLTNAGYNKYDFWTSGNNLGTDMFLWMSTGLPFNATFNYMKKPSNDNTSDIPNGSTSPQRTARESGDSDSMNSCVALKAPSFEWDIDYCTAVKDFICEQTRCYYYNYGSIPVSSAQGKISYLQPTTTLKPSPTLPTLPKTAEKKAILDRQDVNKLITKYRRTNTQKVSLFKEDIELDLPATNGPYVKNYYANVRMRDDPSAFIDDSSSQNRDEGDYVSTIEPDAAVTASPKYPYGLSSNNK